jgi:glycosyltransferase involved in cell wall biosynthesis
MTGRLSKGSPPPTIDELPDPPEHSEGWPWTEQSTPLPSKQSDGNPWPKISIVTPSYNQGQYIEETIRSILLQGYPNLEYIVVDGGSDDETVDILEKYDPWIDYWVSEPDEGQSDATQKGLDRCTGTVFNWINSDDLLEPGALATISRHIDGHDAVIGLGRHFTEEKSWMEDTYNFAPRPLLRGFGRENGCGFTQQAVWLRTDQVKACGGVDPSFHYAMDRELYVRYTYEYPDVTYVDEPLARFRLHENSKSEQSGLGEKADNPFRREFVQMAKKIRGMDEYADLHGLCDERIEWWEWLLTVARLRGQDDRSALSRAGELLAQACAAPRSRLTRFTAGALRDILLTS